MTPTDFLSDADLQNGTDAHLPGPAQQKRNYQVPISIRDSRVRPPRTGITGCCCCCQNGKTPPANTGHVPLQFRAREVRGKGGYSSKGEHQKEYIHLMHMPKTQQSEMSRHDI